MRNFKRTMDFSGNNKQLSVADIFNDADVIAAVTAIVTGLLGEDPEAPDLTAVLARLDALESADTVITALANAKLAKASNLSDIAVPATGLTNLGGVPSTRTVAGKALSSNVTLAKADVGLNLVDNVADVDKPVSTATQNALNTKADVSSGKLPISQLPSGAELSIYCVAGTWPARPTSRTDITVNYRSLLDTDPDPSDFIADKDYLFKEPA